VNGAGGVAAPAGCRFAAIVNPISGRFHQADKVRRTGELLRQRGHRFEVKLTRAPGDAVRLADELPDDTRAVLVVGGDGTAREVTSALMGREIPVVILRTGTENLLAKDLCMPTDPRTVVRTLLEGVPFRTDVGVADGRRFFIVAGFGFDAEVVQRLTARRNGHITHLNYLDPIWRTFWTHRYPTIRVEADGAEVYCGRGFALVNVLPRYAAGLRTCPQACRDDGLLDLVVFPCSKSVKLVHHFWCVLLGCSGDSNGAIWRKAQTIRVTSPQPVPVELDGDPAGWLPVSITVEPRAALFMGPPEPRA
jgi:diacylglycerol kinase family enzyme